MQNRTPSRPTVPDFTPVPRKYRHDGWTAERQRAFLEALADTGSVKHAAKTVNMSPEGAYALRRQPGAEEFAAAWEAALTHGIRRLEDIALEHAITGVEVPVYSYGKLVGTRIVHNDRLLMFLLRNRAPDRFGTSAMRRASGPSADQIAALRRQWEQEKAVYDEAAIEDTRRELRIVHERLMKERSEDEREFAEWQEAKEEDRAVILPREE
ncbi:MAG: hypothetical protein ABW169_04640 [Sphingobium sp.]